MKLPPVLQRLFSFQLRIISPIRPRRSPAPSTSCSALHYRSIIVQMLKEKSSSHQLLYSRSKLHNPSLSSHPHSKPTISCSSAAALRSSHHGPPATQAFTATEYNRLPKYKRLLLSCSLLVLFIPRSLFYICNFSVNALPVMYSCIAGVLLPRAFGSK